MWVAKDTIKNEKTETVWGKIWNVKNWKRLVFKIDFWNYKSKRKWKQPSRQTEKDIKRQFTEEETQIANKHVKMFNLTRNQQDVN